MFGEVGNVWSKVKRVICRGLGVILVGAVIYIFFMSGSLASIPTKISDEYPLGDEEVNYMISLVVHRGGEWYKDFSIAYPPGRYLTLAMLYEVMPPTFATYHLYWRIWGLITPVAFFYLCLLIYQELGAKRYLALTSSAVATFVYLSFVHSMQEAHVMLMLMGLVLLANMRKIWKSYLAVFLLGLIFLFRVDLGVITTLAGSIVFKQIKEKTRPKDWIVGFLAVWAPVITYILLNGSLGNFLHDTVVLGLILQPKQMSLPIPNNSFWLVYWATLIALLTGGGDLLARARGKGALGVRLMAGVMILAYVAALGRSDEAHLWYGLAFWPILTGYYLLRVRELKVTAYSVWITAVVVGWSYLILKLKSPTLYLLSGSLYLVAMSKIKVEKLGNLALTGLAVSLLIFHSVSFLKLRMSMPHTLLPERWEEGTFRNDPGEVAGLRLGMKTELMLAEVKEIIQEDSIFLYPDHTLYYEYLGKKNPSRHYFMIGESTEKTEGELLAGAKMVKYVLLFPTSARSIGSKVEKYILENTSVVRKFEIGKMEITLREKTKPGSEEIQ